MHESCSRACVVDRDFFFCLLEISHFHCFESSSINLCQANRMLISKMKRCMILDIITCSCSLVDWSNAWHYTSLANTKFGQMWGFIILTHFVIFSPLHRLQALSSLVLEELTCLLWHFTPQQTLLVEKKTWLVHEIAVI